jgi:hypothetical protein
MAIAACRTCGTEPLEHARFCHGCGAPVEDAGIRAEYKQVTVLFADVVHSMDFAATAGATRARHHHYRAPPPAAATRPVEIRSPQSRALHACRVGTHRASPRPIGDHHRPRGRHRRIQGAAMTCTIEGCDKPAEALDGS